MGQPEFDRQPAGRRRRIPLVRAAHFDRGVSGDSIAAARDFLDDSPPKEITVGPLYCSRTHPESARQGPRRKEAPTASEPAARYPVGQLRAYLCVEGLC